ncbi:MAG TPA: xanthine dehydrogenase family protein molybdopterin-binding subunit [Candidatus Acidoferrales bacterium]|nr:xanthine dehydrogenase family protein molybdopterin-binding subunit [Candidatus Acidoferrales bacterium]
MTVIGEPLTRVDGRLKVTGAAKYSAEFTASKIAYGVIVQSTIPCGRIARMDTAEAAGLPGVVAVMTPQNTAKLSSPEKRLSLLQDDAVNYNRQPIAIAIAESLHAAQSAADMVRVTYDQTPAKLDFYAGFPASYTFSHNNEPGDMSWGDVNAGLAQAAVRIDQIYTTPIEHHSPMEPHATFAEWDGDQLIVHDATQNVFGVRQTLSRVFGLPEGNVRVLAPFIGGGFGCKGQVWSHVVLAAMAARHVNRPVKIVLDRPQMFGPIGARPRTHQHLTLGATNDGKLTAIRHEVHANTSVLEDYLESSAFPTRVMYACENVATVSRIVPLNLGTPTYMRAPGVATGTYALEVAMDELAYTLQIDPLELRLLNYTDVDPHTKKPFTEKSLRECYSRGAEKFGWSRRNPEPRSMKNGSQLVGWGMATETYPANRIAASAFVRLLSNGRVLVGSGSEEIGNGMYTIMTQVAADVMQVPVELIDAKVGDSTLPQAPVAAGSMSTASVMPAVKAAASEARRLLIDAAVGDPSSVAHGAAPDEIEFRDGKIFRKSTPGRTETFVELIARRGGKPIEGAAQTRPGEELTKFAHHSFGAVFAEVSVDPDLGMIRVPRIVAVFDVGRLINPKTATNQFVGGIVWGVSLALHEDTYIDPSTGRVANANLGEYRVPVNADIGDIDVSAIDIPDTNFNSVGARGIGEIGITGTGAAVANAVFHATGKRVRDLPITPDKLL